MRKKVGNEDPVLRERQESMHRKAAALAWFKHGRKGSSLLGSGRGGNLSKMQMHAPRGRMHQATGASSMGSNGASEGIGHQAYNASSIGNNGASERITHHAYNASSMGSNGVSNGASEGTRHHAYDAPSMGSNGASEDIGAYDKESIATMSMGATLVPPNMETSYHNLSSMHQASLSRMHQANLSPKHQASRFKAEALALKNSSSSSSSSSSADTTTTSSSNTQQMINMSTGQSLALLSLLPHHQSQNCFNLSKKEYAANSSNSNITNNATTTAASPWDCGSSLYDSFELLCLSNQLGRCLTSVNAAAMAGSSSSSSSYSKIINKLASNPLHGPPLQPSYIPRSLHTLPQFMIPNYLATKSSKKRSSLIHPIFSIPNAANGTPPSPSLPAPPASSSPLHSHSKKSPSVAEDYATRKKTESGGFRRVFNSLLKSLHIKEDSAHQKPKRSNLSEELEKLPKNRPPSSRGALKYEDPAAAMAFNRSPSSYSSYSSAEMGSRRSPTSSSSSSSSAAALETRRRSPNSSSSATSAASRKAPPASSAPPYHHFRNEGFRTASKPPKSVKWVQPGAF